MKSQRVLKIAYKDPYASTCRDVANSINAMTVELVDATRNAAKEGIGKEDLLKASEIAIKSMRRVQVKLRDMRASGDDKRYFESYNAMDKAVNNIDTAIGYAIKILKQLRKIAKSANDFGPYLAATPPENAGSMDEASIESSIPKYESSVNVMESKTNELKAFPRKTVHYHLKKINEGLVAALKFVMQYMEDEDIPDTNSELYDVYRNLISRANTNLKNLNNITPRKFS